MGTAEGTPAPDISVVLCTFNRAALLRQALEALVRQRDEAPLYEVLVVDNNSGDETPEVVASFASTGLVHYLLEPEQGLSAARNHGIRVARAPLVAFTDDDVCVDPAWLRTICATSARHPQVDFFGGKVLPVWEQAPPHWLGAAGTAPLALVDYGDRARLVDRTDALCLVGANLVIRRRAFERVGLFSRRLQRVGDGIGSTEDHELELRLIAAEHRGLYEPSLVVRAKVPRHRLRRRYHRAWHAGHGRYYALMRDPAFERSSRTIFDVPGHVYRAALCELGAWLRELLRLRTAAAFAHELRLRFLLGFAGQRVLDRRHA
jgi:glycosyltransferase involved in cell wall biosynthesis